LARLTTYKQIEFATEREARWAVFLDAAGEEWRYEKPDQFWLPRMDCHLLLKATRPTVDDEYEAVRLRDFGWKPVILGWGQPRKLYRTRQWDPRSGGSWVADGLMAFCNNTTESGSGESEIGGCFWALDRNDRLCITSAELRDHKRYTIEDLDLWEAMKHVGDIKSEIPDAWVAHARDFRFTTPPRGAPGPRRVKVPRFVFEVGGRKVVAANEGQAHILAKQNARYTQGWVGVIDRECEVGKEWAD
jgi:hypothetical protein